MTDPQPTQETADVDKMLGEFSRTCRIVPDDFARAFEDTQFAGEAAFISAEFVAALDKWVAGVNRIRKGGDKLPSDAAQWREQWEAWHRGARYALTCLAASAPNGRITERLTDVVWQIAIADTTATVTAGE